MALGYCMVCEKLVSIRPGEVLAGRARAWYPITHDNPEGRPCAGDRKAIK